MDIINVLEFPLCQKTRVPIKTLAEQLGRAPKERKLLESHISSINLISLLNEQTMKIRAYKDDSYSFQVIYVFDIALKANDKMTDLTELVHSAFPESTLLFLSYKDTLYISGALKRINKNDCTKSVIEDSVWAEVIDGINIDIPSVTTLKEYYENLIRLIYRIKVKNVTGLFPDADKDYKELIKQYETLVSQINRLNENYLSASMRNEKMRIDNELYKKELELDNLKSTINRGDCHE